MSQADILAAIRASTPFVPIEMTLSTSEKVVIPHSDAALVARRPRRS